MSLSQQPPIDGAINVSIFTQNSLQFYLSIRLSFLRLRHLLRLTPLFLFFDGKTFAVIGDQTPAGYRGRSDDKVHPDQQGVVK